MKDTLAQSNPFQSCQAPENFTKYSKNQPKGENRQQIQPIVTEKEADSSGFNGQKNKVNNEHSQNKVVYDLKATFHGQIFNMKK